MTDAAPVSVNVQLLALFPPLEQAPDQMASRPFETLSVIAAPVVNSADSVLPTATLIPAGLDVTRSPLRPVAVTVSVAVAAGGATVSAAVRVTPAALAVMVATVDTVADVVAMVKVALVAPAATVTLAGTVAAALLLESVTPNPPAGAADVNVTVPCTDVPPVTLVGLTETADSEAGGGGGVTVSVAVLAAPPYAPVIVTAVEALTALVVMVNVALVAPAATVTLAGTVATAVLLLDSVTTAPPVGAALVSVAVPCAELPPTTLVGLSAIAESDGAAGAVMGVKRMAVDHGPAVPAELMPRTRHQCRTLANPPVVNCDGVTV